MLSNAMKYKIKKGEAEEDIAKRSLTVVQMWYEGNS